MLYEHTERINGIVYGIRDEKIYNVTEQERHGLNEDEPEIKYIVYKGKHFADCLDELERIKNIL